MNHMIPSTPRNAPTRRVKVEINRGEGNDWFTGTILAESTTWYFVEWLDHLGHTGGREWFAKASTRCNCTLMAA